MSKVVNYVQYDRHPKNFYNLNIKAIVQKSHNKIRNKEEERQMLELDFGDTPGKLKGEHLYMYEGVITILWVLVCQIDILCKE